MRFIALVALEAAGGQGLEARKWTIRLSVEVGRFLVIIGKGLAAPLPPAYPLLNTHYLILCTLLTTSCLTQSYPYILVVLYASSSTRASVSLSVTLSMANGCQGIWSPSTITK